MTVESHKPDNKGVNYDLATTLRKNSRHGSTIFTYRMLEALNLIGVYFVAKFTNNLKRTKVEGTVSLELSLYEAYALWSLYYFGVSHDPYSGEKYLREAMEDLDDIFNRNQGDPIISMDNGCVKICNIKDFEKLAEESFCG